MEYLPVVSINKNILDIMNKLDTGELDKCSETTLVYYSIKLIAEIDRLSRSLSQLAEQAQVRVAELIDKVKAALDKLNSKIHYVDYFKDSDNEHAYIHMLHNYRNSGMTLDEALQNLTLRSGTPRNAILDIIKDEKYPMIDPSSRSFSLGRDLAQNNRGDILDDMYKHLDDLKLGTDQINNFIAGYLTVRPLGNTESTVESLKSKLYQFNYTHERAEEIVSECDNYLWR